MLTPRNIEQLEHRLSRLIGQVTAIKNGLREDLPEGKVLTQIKASTSALRSFTQEYLKLLITAHILDENVSLKEASQEIEKLLESFQ